MTTDRKRAVFFLSLTLIIGILIGSLVPGFIGRFRHRDSNMRGGKDNKEKEMVNKHDRFTHMILRVVKADSAQAKLIKPLIEETAASIEELEKGSNQQMATIMDSLKVKLQPILTPEQLQKLNDFEAKAKNHWRGGKRGANPNGHNQ